ncbi:MAG: peptide-methionine (S)-S-oxide reductase MsrA [Ectothiorhodospiraceae bacterium]|nr:peptide-methionine (S)-S-oxide reductase MsrA [Ectothiorhodospiraceae bacterium]
MLTESEALPGRDESILVPETHFVNGHPMQDPFPQGVQMAMFGMGCFWGAEKVFWIQPGVYSTAVGYAAGITNNPNYQEVCSGQTGHNEVVRVIFDPDTVSYAALLALFWQGHNPTQGMRQGNDRGTQYRSGVYVYDEVQRQQAEEMQVEFQEKLTSAGFPMITTEVLAAPTFYFAEEYHQQYLAKNPGGYCGLGGTGVNLSE